MQKAMPQGRIAGQKVAQSGEILRETSIHAWSHGTFASCYADLALMGMQISLMRQTVSTNRKICRPSLAIRCGASPSRLSNLWKQSGPGIEPRWH